jgi:hypothetical protein
MQVEPAAHQTRRVPGIEMAQGRLDQIEQRRGRSVLDREAIGELGDVPGRGDTHEVVADGRIDGARLRAREHVKLATARELIRGVRERLRVPRHAARRTSDALCDDVDLPEVAAEEHEDAVGLSEIDRPQDDRFGAIRARRHQDRMLIAHAASWTSTTRIIECGGNALVAGAAGGPGRLH